MTSRGLGLAAALSASALALACATTPAAREAARIVAVGDVHGGYERFTGLLRAAGLVDTGAHWSGGRSVLVQLGDSIDRGPDDRRVLELLMRLESEARAAGGDAIALLGNHEVMNLHGDLRYVSRQTYASFAEPGSPALPGKRPGYAEHREAFGPTGRYGKWLRERPILAIVGGVAFVHGGVTAELAARGADRLNQLNREQLALFDQARALLVARRPELRLAELAELRREAAAELAQGATKRERAPLEMFTRYGTWMCAHPRGPLWFRGYAEWSDAELGAELPAVLAGLGVRHVVVGHSPQAGGRIRARANGAVLLIDTGLLGPPFYPGGSAQALEIEGGRFSVIDENGERTPLSVQSGDLRGARQRSSIAAFRRAGSAAIAKNPS